MTLRSLISSRLSLLGVSPKRSLGQNFLIDEAIVKKILSLVEKQLGPNSQIVEVGPGLGSLTESLISLGKPLRLIELDRQFCQFWRDRGQEVEEGDALQMDWKNLHLGPASLLISNLPYQISSSLVIDRCLETASIGAMILMFQKEVAQRIIASPRTKNYGLLTVMAQTFWEISSRGEVGPCCFLPAPQVASQILEFQLKPSIPLIRNKKDYLHFLKSAFSHRRKVIWKNLSAFLPQLKDKNFLSIFVETQKNVGMLTRAEELSPAQFVQLYLRLCEERVGIEKD